MLSKNILLTTSLIAVSSAAFAAFSTVETFESGTASWQTDSTMDLATIADPLNASNQVGVFTSTSTTSSGLAYASINISPISSGIATLFYQVYLPGTAYNHVAAVTDTDPSIGGWTWDALDSISRFGGNSGGTGFDVYDEGSYYVTATSLEGSGAGGWYSIWQVLDLDNNLTDIYIQSDTDTAFNTQQKIYDNAGFRGSYDAAGLDKFAILISGNASDAIYIDNVLLDTSGENLANPIPEPSTYALAAGLLVLTGITIFRRR